MRKKYITQKTNQQTNKTEELREQRKVANIIDNVLKAAERNRI